MGECAESMGEYGLTLIEAIHQKNPDRPVNILTHCNAGRMATVEWGTATSPIYHAHQKGCIHWISRSLHTKVQKSQNLNIWLPDIAL